jgi:hypothetical protein
MTPITRKTTRVTAREYVGRYADARGRKLVVSLLPGDMLMLRPARTQRAEYIRLSDVYDIALRSRVLAERMTKLNAKRRAK